MKAKLLIGTVLLFAAIATQAQTLGEFKPKDQSYGMGKIKGKTRIYIAGFQVHFQVYNEKEKFKQGGSMLGGGKKGDALTGISVGLEGLDEKTVQEITDQLYLDYISKLKAKGMTIINADEAGKIEAYEDYTRMQGGKITAAEIPGVLTCTPTGFEYFIKGLDSNGKEKKGGFLGNDAMKFPRLSKELDDAIIGNVDLTVLFVSDKETFQGNGAKLKVKTNLRLVDTEGVTMTNDSKIKLKGSNSVTMVTSQVAFYHGKMGAGSTTSYVGTLGKPVAINGVINEETMTSYAAGTMDALGTETLYGRVYSIKDGISQNAKVIPVDPAKYRDGVYNAAKKFLDFHTDEFLKAL